MKPKFGSCTFLRRDTTATTVWHPKKVYEIVINLMKRGKVGWRPERRVYFSRGQLNCFLFSFCLGATSCFASGSLLTLNFGITSGVQGKLPTHCSPKVDFIITILGLFLAVFKGQPHLALLGSHLVPCWDSSVGP